MPAYYSIVVPAYNESARILPTLERVLSFVREQGWQAEIVVVNDGSRDNTAEVVANFARRQPMVRLVENPGNRGKGYSVRNGVRHARGEVILFTDADLSSPIEEAPKLFDAIERGNDLAIGSRWLQSDLQTARQPLYRQILGRAFNVALKLILGFTFRDTQCGFKAFTRRAGKEIFSRQRIDRWCFDPEVLFLARKLGYRTEEVPVAWAHDDRSKINPIADGISMLKDLLKIRWNSITGKYSSRPENVPESVSEESPVLHRPS
jgi:glycosyltransferase involved in cell wall biosynthesis